MRAMTWGPIRSQRADGVNLESGGGATAPRARRLLHVNG